MLGGSAKFRDYGHYNTLPRDGDVLLEKGRTLYLLEVDVDTRGKYATAKGGYQHTGSLETTFYLLRTRKKCQQILKKKKEHYKDRKASYRKNKIGVTGVIKEVVVE